jgi:hypothetical protein
MGLSRSVFVAALVSFAAFGQSYTISTFAGGGLPVNIPGPSASLAGAYGVAVDSAGNVFFTNGNTVLRLDVGTGVLTLVAGTGTAGFSGDNGPAASAKLSLPTNVAVDSTGNLYIADTANNRIRQVSNGVITTVVGNGTPGFSGDNGPATSAQLYGPSGVAVDSTGNLYIGDTVNNRIRKVSDGVITTVAGNGTFGFSGDNGPATVAQLDSIGRVAVDSAGNLYIADTYTDRIRKVSNGVITTVAGNGATGFSGDGALATSAQLYRPEGVAVDSAGNLYIADAGNNRIRRVSNGMITTVAGNGTAGFSGDGGPATSAQLWFPTSAVVDRTGNLYIADLNNHRIRNVSNGVITTVAGNGVLGGGDNGPATAAQIAPSGVGVDLAGDLYIADADNRVRMVSNGIITTIAGNGTLGFSGDNGPATNAQLASPTGVAVDSANNLYIADFGSFRVREVSNGVIATVAGSTPGFGGDTGPAVSAQLSAAEGVAVDSAGNLYIADTYNQRIRRVSDGVITTVAGGRNGPAGFTGDNGPATSAQLHNPGGIAGDSAGNLYIADMFNYRIRTISNGVITTIAGNGMLGFSGDGGPPTSAAVNVPEGVAVDSAGNLYIADTNNSRVRKVSNGVITTIAGNGTAGFSGDNGPATSAQLDDPMGVAVDSSGKVYIADSGNLRVRVLTPTAPAASTTAVTNAASNLAGPVAPGEIVVITGSGLGPSNLVTGFIADPVVTFDGVPANLIYAEASQIAAVVPDGVAGNASTLLQVHYQGQVVSAAVVPVTATAPGLFTLDGSGSGQGAILNQDDITAKSLNLSALLGGKLPPV